MSWDAFFNNDDAVKSIKKASNRLRPGGTLCMMPKYVDAIEGRLKFCSTSSVIGLCNRKGNDSTSCRALWKKHVSPEEQETFLSKLHTLTGADFEEFQHKFGEAMMLRIHEVYEEEKHTNTLGYNQGLNELRESVEKLKINRANEIAESTPTKEDETSRPPLDSNTRKAFAHLTKDDLITMYIESKREYDKFVTSRYRLDTKIGTPYTPSKYQQTKQEGVCEDFLKGECKKGDTCAFSHEENLHEDIEAIAKSRQENEKKINVNILKEDNKKLMAFYEEAKSYFDDDANIQKIIHVGITCDMCGVLPIRGARYKCTNKDDYDLCGKCHLEYNNSLVGEDLLKFERKI